MSGSLFHWRGDIEEEVKNAMRARGLDDVSPASCQQFVRQFIQEVIPRWSPGAPLPGPELREIGACWLGNRPKEWIPVEAAERGSCARCAKRDAVQMLEFDYSGQWHVCQPCAIRVAAWHEQRNLS